MEPQTEQSKSIFFTLVNGTLVVSEETAGVASSGKLPGGVLDNKYEVIELIGRGGMGAVFRARHLGLDKEVALKTFGGAHLTEEVLLRFQREAQAIAKLSQRHVVQIFDFGQFGEGVPYYTMEYLLGETLADCIERRGRLPVSEALALFQQVCDGLVAAHHKGIIHRDLKPANLFVERSGHKTIEGNIKIVDFGIASLTGQSGEAQKLTLSGTIFGSPLYMSPEQALGENTGAGTDIYSLGCTMFEALTGRPPFRGGNALETIMMHQTLSPPTLTEMAQSEKFPERLEALIASMLAKSPSRRPKSIDAVLETISALRQSGEPLRKTAVDVGNSPAHPKSSLTSPEAGAATGRSPKAETPAQTYFDTDARTTSASSPGKNKLAIFTTAVIVSFLLAGGGLALKNFFQTAGQSPSDTAPGPSSSSLVSPRREVLFEGFKRTIKVSFPKDFLLGQFKYGSFGNKDVTRYGTAVWDPRKGRPLFEPSEQFNANPANFDVFAPDDLLGLEILHGDQGIKNDNLLMHISRLTGLQLLSLNQSVVEDDSIRWLLKLHDLRQLSIINTNLTGKALAQMPQLSQLTNLSFGNSVGVKELLVALRNNHSLERLNLNSVSLDAEDIKNISTISSLKTLLMNSSNVQPRDISPLTSLKHLRTLSINDCSLRGKELDTIKKLVANHLSYLMLSKEGLTEAEQHAVMAIYPKVKLEDRFNGRSGEATPQDWQSLSVDFDQYQK